MPRTTPYKAKQAGLPDLLNFAAVVDEGIVLNKDGSLMAGWYYQGSDISSSTDDELNAVSAQINGALARLKSGWMTHHDAIRFQAKDYPGAERSFFADNVSRLIDAERRAQFEEEGAHFESMYAVVVTYLPPVSASRRLADFMYDEEKREQVQAQGTRVLDSFKLQIAELEDALSTIVRLRRMQGVRYQDEYGQQHVNEELLQYLNYTITGENHPVNLPPCPMYIDALLGGQELWTGVTPKLGTKCIKVVSVDGFPLESTPAILSALDKVPISYRWSTRFIYMDAEEAKKHLVGFRRKWQQKTRGFLDQVFKTNRSGVDQDAVTMVDETETALGEASGQLVTYGYYTCVVVLMSEDRGLLDESARMVRRTLQSLGFGCRIETINTMEAWLGSIPGHALPNLRRPLLHTMHLADLLPTASIWPGHDTCPCPLYPPGSPPLLHAATEGATPFRLNLHVGDVGHTLIFGPTGAGKSTLLGLIVAQFRRYPGASVFAFDKGNSLYALTRACGGQHYEIASDRGVAKLMPLANIDSEGDLAWAVEWIEMCAALQLGTTTVTPAQRSAILTAMKLLRGQPRPGRTITNFVTNVQEPGIKQALEYYTITGNAGDLLDNETESIGDANFLTFEMEELMNRGEKVVIPVLLYLFRKIEKALRGQPALLALDEAWIMLGHPVFRAKIREWLKVLRKANCTVILATQSLSDAVRSEILDVLMESCPTKILLPNPEAGKGDDAGNGPRGLYRLMGLNERQIEIVAKATPKREYYYVSPEGRRLINLNLGAIALSFVGASSKTDGAVIRELENTHGRHWPERWLEKRGVPYPPEAFAEN